MSKEAEKKAAGYAAVDEYIAPLLKDLKHQIVIGVGSGSTVVYFVERLAQAVKDANVDKSLVMCIPTSFQAKQLILENPKYLTIGELNQYIDIDVAVDGADEVDANLNCIKGGGGCHLQEKLVADNAKTFVVIADSGKDSRVLGEKWKAGVPIEVVPMAYVPVIKKITNLLNDLYATKATATSEHVKLRMAVKKAGPVVTDNGNFVLDVIIDFNAISNISELNAKLLQIPGVVETGLFINMAVKAIFGQPDGTIVSRTRQ